MHKVAELGRVAIVCLAMTAPASAADIAISNAWFRALPSGQPAGGYFKMKNRGTDPVELIAAESAACGMLMLHQSVLGGGVSRMQDVKSVIIQPRGTISFAPGGYHLMCSNPDAAMAPGKSVAVTLIFSDGSKVHADFVVKNVAGK